MKPHPNILLVLVLLSISIFSAAGSLIAVENRTLDGNVYDAILNDEDDILTFRDGSFQSTLYAGRGYDKGEYTTVIKGDSIWFEAKTISPRKGELLWTGVIEGSAINGSYLYTKKGWFLFGDTTKRKDFKGSLKTE
ncbi:MAG: hypothetical protein ACN4GW_05380 [Desulforhopalus sp.]